MAEKVGIYLCHCGSNIAGQVDVEEVARWAGKNIKDVAVSLRSEGKIVSDPYEKSIASMPIETEREIRAFLASLGPNE